MLFLGTTCAVCRILPVLSADTTRAVCGMVISHHQPDTGVTSAHIEHKLPCFLPACVPKAPHISGL